MVRDPYGLRPPGPVMSWAWACHRVIPVVCALLHSLRLEASLADHMAAVMVRDP